MHLLNPTVAVFIISVSAIELDTPLHLLKPISQLNTFILDIELQLKKRYYSIHKNTI